MKVWELNLIIGIIVFIVGIFMFMLPMAGMIESLDVGAALFLFGMFIAGIGMGLVISTYTIYRLEKPKKGEK